MLQGRIAALNALGIETLFNGLPRSNVVKVLDEDIFSVGEINPPDGSYTLHESRSKEGYHGFILHDGSLAGGIVIGNKTLASSLKQAVESHMPFPADKYRNCTDILHALHHA